MKHTYGERTCMACGGGVCNLDYSDLRKQVESEKMAPLGHVRSGVESGPSIEKGMHKPLGRMAHGGMMYAEGGPVASPSPGPVSEGGWNTFTAGMNKALGSSPANAAEASEPVKKAKGGMMEASDATIDDKIGNPFKSKGGEIEGSEEEGGDDEMLMDHCANEMMDALEKKDKTAFKDALHVLVADVLRKLS